MDDKSKKIRLEYIITQFESSLTNGNIQVYYQPVIRSLTGKLCGFEALVRWIDKEYGFLSPADFLPILEAFHLIHKLDINICEQVCRRLKERITEGSPVVPVSINLSRLDFEFCDIVNEIDSVVTKYQIPKELIEVEVTEEAVTKNPEHMTQELKRFRDAGYEVWMDDFGSGYSSLNILKDIEFDVLKIDMLFLSSLNEKSKKIITAIVDMAKNIGLQTLAEGVEIQEHFDFLKGIGCEKIQGYYYGKPLSFDNAMENINSKGIRIEPIEYKNYLDEIGKVNLLSVNPKQTSDESKFDSSKRLNGISWAIIEFNETDLKYLNTNEAYIKTLESIGFTDLYTLEKIINDKNKSLSIKFLEYIKRIINSNREESFDFIEQGAFCNIRGRAIASYGDKNAVLITLSNLSKYTHFNYKMDLEEAIIFLLTLFDRVDRFCLDDSSHESLYKNSHYEASADIKESDKEIAYFTETQIYSEDRVRFLEFYNMNTIEARIKESGRHYLEDFFRTKGDHGEYRWCRFTLINATTVKNRIIISCQMEASRQITDTLSQKHVKDDILHKIKDDTLTNDIILSNILMSSQSQGIYWKDKDRRFAGCNKQFLDFTGLTDISQIKGKTSEEAGVIFTEEDSKKEDRIYNEGHKYYNESLQCLINGRLKDIILTAYPVYKDNRIIGSIGSFINITNGEGLFNGIYRDKTTKAFNMKGLIELSHGYEDTFVSGGLDFAYIRLNIKNLNDYKNQWGITFVNAILKEVYETINRATEKSLDIFHIQDSDFIIIKQYKDINEVSQTADRIKKAVCSITQINNSPCTLYATSSSAVFSQAKSCNDLLSLVLSEE